MANEIITVIANLALTLSFIVALVFGIAQVRAAERDRRERFTLETLQNFQTREFAELIHYIAAHNNTPSNREELQALPEADQVTFIQLAQQMEMLGILVADGFINLDLVDKTLGSFVTTAWEKYKIMFTDMRGNDPFLGEYFQWLAERIEVRLRENPREPFYQTRIPIGRGAKREQNENI